MIARGWLDNPCPDNERFDLHVPLVARGRLAKRLLSLCGLGEPVILSGHMTTVRSNNEMRLEFMVQRVEVAEDE